MEPFPISAPALRRGVLIIDKLSQLVFYVSNDRMMTLEYEGMLPYAHRIVIGSQLPVGEHGTDRGEVEG